MIIKNINFNVLDIFRQIPFKIHPYKTSFIMGKRCLILMLWRWPVLTEWGKQSSRAKKWHATSQVYWKTQLRMRELISWENKIHWKQSIGTTYITPCSNFIPKGMHTQIWKNTISSKTLGRLKESIQEYQIRNDCLPLGLVHGHNTWNLKMNCTGHKNALFTVIPLD